MNVYRHAGVRRVAILDFDVHHGNGTGGCWCTFVCAGWAGLGRCAAVQDFDVQHGNGTGALLCLQAERVAEQVAGLHTQPPCRRPTLPRGSSLRLPAPAEACVTNTIPSRANYKFSTPYR